MSNCITHHFACECREEQFKKIEAERDEYMEKAIQLTRQLHIIAMSYALQSNDGQVSIVNRICAKAKKAYETYGVKEMGK